MLISLASELKIPVTCELRRSCLPESGEGVGNAGAGGGQSRARAGPFPGSGQARSHLQALKAK